MKRPVEKWVLAIVKKNYNTYFCLYAHQFIPVIYYVLIVFEKLAIAANVTNGQRGAITNHYVLLFEPDLL